MSRRAFTLIELLVAVTVGIALLAATSSAFIQIRQMVQRRTAIVQLHREASVLQTQLDQRLTALMPHAACVIDARSVLRGGSSRPTLRLLYLRGKQHANDWGRNPDDQSDEDRWVVENTDLLWELWEYRPEEQTLYLATQWRDRSFTYANAANPADPLIGKSFSSMPQPRLDLAGPDWWTALDGNRRFPAGGIAGDNGDWTDLQQRLLPVCGGITALTLAVEQHGLAGATEFTAGWDGTTASSASAPASASPLIMAGLHHDGEARDGSGREPWAAGYTWSTTRAALRPRLLRLRWTAVDPSTRIEQVFSFSFTLPAVAAPGP